MRLATGIILGHYEIISLLGEGGMGEVYVARDTKLDRKVALKVLPTEVASHRDRLNRFIREAKAAAALNHQNIAHIYEINESNDINFIIMELIDGQTLRSKILQGPLDLREAIDIATQCASALVAAHEAAIIHRDIKPDNVMIRRDGIIKLLDFGLAKLVIDKDAELNSSAPTVLNVKTRPGAVMGTPSYMSPEQARGLDLDGRTDIFSLGVVLHEMVTGRLPFSGANSYEIVSSILNEQEAPPLGAGAPVELERITAKMLRKAREGRYQTCPALLLDLKGLKDNLRSDVTLKKSRRSMNSPYRSLPEGVTKRLAQVAKFLVILAIAAALVATIFYFIRNKSRGSIQSVAVLPFVNENKDPNTEYLSDGISESIINSLSQLPNLKVMSRNSVFNYKERSMNARDVAKELNVESVLTGRLAQQGDNLIVSVELIDGNDNSQIWGGRYNRRLADVFLLQQELAQDISSKLRLTLSRNQQQQLGRPPTTDLRAFQYYMQGRAYIHRNTREDLQLAIQYFQRAIDQDPKYALAYSGLAEANMTLGARGWISPLEGRRLCEEAARMSISLDETLAEAHTALGQAYTTFSPANFELGESELRHAIELSPSLAAAHTHLGYTLVRQGRLDESLPELMKARELDPLSSIITRNLALPYYLKRDYKVALELIRQANKLGPTMSTTVEISFYIQLGLFDEAFAELEKAKGERPNDPLLSYDYGMLYAARGQRAEALQVVKQLEETSGVTLNQAHFIAKIYAVLNDKEQAFAWLERGLDVGAIGSFYKDEPIWDFMRNDVRFNELLEKMGIP